MIDVYTVNKWYGPPIKKQKALKITNATVVFENGKCEKRSSYYRSHFLTLDEAIVHFNKLHSRRRASLESELRSVDKRADSFFNFVWKERGFK